MTGNLAGPALRCTGIILLTASLTLVGCAGTPPEEPRQAVASPPQEPAAVAPPPERVTLQLPASSHTAAFSAAEQSLSRFDWMDASAALDGIAAASLNPDDRAYYEYLQARVDYVRGDDAAALARLESYGSGGIHPALRYRVLSFQQYILDMQGDPIGSARIADQILRLGQLENAAAWRRTLWRNLQRPSDDLLKAALDGTADPRWRAWLELALISRDTGPALSGRLQLWQQNNPGHPAAASLPGGLDYVTGAAAPWQKTALILPLSDRLAPAGKAVLEGYMAAYYAAMNAGSPVPELLVLDATTYPSATDAYDEAVRQGAEMVVGPLSREGVADLATRLDRPVPVLALNRLDHRLPESGSALVQLSLAPEDEAERLAELAYGEGARSALVIRSSDDWSGKVDRALQDRWRAIGGIVVGNVSYDNPEEYSSTIKSLLGLPASTRRAEEIEGMLAANVEFTPRRRQDADVIFLLSSNPQEARSIKPLLAFHYAGNLPVFALSSVYSGIPEPRNRDLNDLNLVETPWLLGAQPELQAAIASANPGANTFPRLNALGADAFLLQAGFARLQAGADALMRGSTGLLSMDPQLQIHREPSPARFDGGVLTTR